MGAVEAAMGRAFSEYLAVISLNPTREKKIRSYASSVQGYMERDARGIGKYVAFDPFIHGSYSYGTAVRPKLGAAEYDLDMILPLTRDFFEAYGPEDALAYVRGRLALNYGRVSQGNKCVRISNEDGFHVDIVPAYAPKGNTSAVQIIDRREGEYLLSHPVAVTDWVNGLNRRTANRFSAGVRILKRWRDIKFGREVKPKSLLLTVLAGRAIEKAMEDSDWRALFSSPATTMAEFVQGLGIAIDTYLDDHGAHIPVPGTDDNVGDRWGGAQRSAFASKLEYFNEIAETACSAATRGSALKRWGKLLGPDFPTEVR
jgi:hypothetical protein